jgi:hypothetical protein
VPYTTYGILHLLGVFGVLLSLGATAALGLQADASARRRNAILHGVGLLLIFVSGFAILGKGGLGFPGWAISKLVIFLLIGMLPIGMRQRNAPWTMTLLALGLVVAAAWLAHFRPF